jgi:hypothetical protein
MAARVTGLQIGPEFRFDPERAAQPRCRVRAHAKLLARNAVDARAGTPHARATAYGVNPRGLRNSSRKTSPGWSGGKLATISSSFAIGRCSSMIIHDFGVLQTAACPPKSYPPSVIDAHRMLSFAVVFQGLETVRRRDAQCIARRRGVRHTKLRARNGKYVMRPRWLRGVLATFFVGACLPAPKPLAAQHQSTKG